MWREPYLLLNKSIKNTDSSQTPITVTLNVSEKSVKVVSRKSSWSSFTSSQQISFHLEAWKANGAVLHLVSITVVSAVGRNRVSAANISQSFLHCFRSISPARHWWWGKCAETDPQGLGNIYTHKSRAKRPHTPDPINLTGALSARLYWLSYCAGSYGRMSINPENERCHCCSSLVFRCCLIRHQYIHYIARSEIFIKMLICMQWMHYEKEIWGLWEITEWDVATFRNYLLITREKEKKIAHLFSCLKLHMYKHIVIFLK